MVGTVTSSKVPMGLVQPVMNLSVYCGDPGACRSFGSFGSKLARGAVTSRRGECLVGFCKEAARIASYWG
jgi:hypothetical protein